MRYRWRPAGLQCIAKGVLSEEVKSASSTFVVVSLIAILFRLEGSQNAGVTGANDAQERTYNIKFPD